MDWFERLRRKITIQYLWGEKMRRSIRAKATAEKKRSFILWAGNSARGQMAEDFLRHYCGGPFEIFSC
jgi:hypothetical protein